MSRKILVTGGAGFIGSHLVDALLSKGHDVCVYDNLETQVHGSLREHERWPDYCNPEAEYVCGDVRDRDRLKKALQKVEVIFHFASVVGVGQSMYEIERYTDVNAHGTAVLLDILANESSIQKRIEKLVVASSMSIYGEGKYECPVHGIVYPKMRSNDQLSKKDWELRCPVKNGDNKSKTLVKCDLTVRPLPTDEEKPLSPTSIYASNKRSQEEMCLSTGMAYSIPTVALRFFNTYGKRQSLSNPYTGLVTIFSNQIINSQAPRIFEDGQQTRDFVHVSDIVEANLLVMESSRVDYSTLNVGAGAPVKVREVADTLLKKTNSDLQPESLNQYRSGDIRHCYADIGKLKAMGYTPQVTLEDGLSELVEWLRSQQSTDHTREATDELRKHRLLH